MELGPISGIISLPVMKIPPAERGISAILNIENSRRAGDESYSGSGHSASGQDDQNDQDVQDNQGAQDTYLSDEPEPNFTAQPSGAASSPHINYFA